MISNHDKAVYARKPYYVSVQSGSILEDPTSAAYELEILANEEEVNELQVLFEDLASFDEAQALHFTSGAFGSASDEQIDSGINEYIGDIYKLLYRLGTSETRNHIATMRLFS